MRVVRALSTRWLMRGRGWAARTPVRTNIRRNEVPRNLDKAYPFWTTDAISAISGDYWERIGAVPQNFAGSKWQEVPEVLGIPASSVCRICFSLAAMGLPIVFRYTWKYPVW